MRDVAKKGDRAMILNARLNKSAIGAVVNVLSDPQMTTGVLRDGTRLPARWANEIDWPAAVDFGLGPNIWHDTAWLLPLRGDPDAQTWTTEQGRKVGA